MNQPAFEELTDRYSKFCTLSETSFETRIEGRLTAYRATRSGQPFDPEIPEWDVTPKSPPGEQKDSTPSQSLDEPQPDQQ